MKIDLDSIVSTAGIDLAAAKAGLAQLDERFGGQHGDIPDGALEGWVNEHFTGRARGFFMALGRAWEKELVAGLPAERQKERNLSPEEWTKERNKPKREAAKASA